MPLQRLHAPRSGGATPQAIRYSSDPRGVVYVTEAGSTKKMSVNPSLTARLRIGFVVLFVLLLIVSFFGVGRLFQIRVNYEDDLNRFFQLELETERLRSAFILEQAASRPASAHQKPSRAELAAAAASFGQTAARASQLTGSDADLTSKLQHLVASEAAWRSAVAVPLVNGHVPPPGVERKLTSTVTNSG